MNFLIRRGRLLTPSQEAGTPDPEGSLPAPDTNNSGRRRRRPDPQSPFCRPTGGFCCPVIPGPSRLRPLLCWEESVPGWILSRSRRRLPGPTMAISWTGPKRKSMAHSQYPKLRGYRFKSWVIRSSIRPARLRYSSSPKSSANRSRFRQLTELPLGGGQSIPCCAPEEFHDPRR